MEQLTSSSFVAILSIFAERLLYCMSHLYMHSFTQLWFRTLFTNLQLFESIDTDDSGYITPEEVQVLFEKMGVEDVSLDDAKSFVAEADTDQDGKLSYKGVHC